MLTRFAKILAISTLALGTAVTSANADCSSAKASGTAVGAVGGGVLGNVITHGSFVGTAVGAVGGLLDQVLDDSEARVEGGLEALHHVEELLDLGLQFHDLFGNGVSASRGEVCQAGDEEDGKDAVAESLSDLHGFP